MAAPERLSRHHPRPQMTRPRWVDLCGTWGFAYDDAAEGLKQQWFARDDVFDRQIRVPYPPESMASGIGDTSYHPVVWYRRTFSARDVRQDRLLIHFGAVDYRASVWVNGHLVVTHEGGQTPFSAEIGPVLVPGDEQVITVRAEDLAHDLTQPRGKQDWRPRPHGVWYERTTGIWQPVWLEPVPETYIESVRWTPDLSRGVVGMKVLLNGEIGGDVTIELRLQLRDELLAAEAYEVAGTTVTKHVALDTGRVAHDWENYLWSPENPNLVDATLRVLRGHDLVDEVRTHVGLRSVGIDKGQFLLNERSVFLRMVLAQNYWPESHLAAPDDDALRREVQQIKELGFNGVRIHQKIEDPRFIHWCEVLGLLVWEEMPSAFDYDEAMLGRIVREWLQVLSRDASSAAVVTWIPFNESWGISQLRTDPAQQHAVRVLYSLTKAVDPTRLVIANDGWEHLVTDIIGVHDYTQSGAALTSRYGNHDTLVQTFEQVRPYYHPILLPDLVHGDQPVMLTEFGGITYRAGSEDYWNAYGAVSSAEDLAKRYEDLVSALLASPAVAGFCYTQLTDTAQECNGLLDDRRLPKIEPQAIAAINGRPAASVAADAIVRVLRDG